MRSELCKENKWFPVNTLRVPWIWGKGMNGSLSGWICLQNLLWRVGWLHWEKSYWGSVIQVWFHLSSSAHECLLSVEQMSSSETKKNTLLYLLLRWVRAHVTFHAVEDFMVETCCVQVATSHQPPHLKCGWCKWRCIVSINTLQVAKS